MRRVGYIRLALYALGLCLSLSVILSGHARLQLAPFAQASVQAIAQKDAGTRIDHSELEPSARLELVRQLLRSAEMEGAVRLQQEGIERIWIGGVGSGLFILLLVLLRFPLSIRARE